MLLAALPTRRRTYNRLPHFVVRLAGFVCDFPLFLNIVFSSAIARGYSLGVVINIMKKGPAITREIKSEIASEFFYY